MTVSDKLQLLRQEMRKEGLSAFIFPSQDAHNSEYTPEHWHGRQWISGFGGSAGTAVVTMHSAALWTDSRYFLAAGEELRGTEFELMKDGLSDTPSITHWLGLQLSDVDVPEVGIDDYCCSYAEGERLRIALRHEGGITLRTNLDILERIWHDRPPIPRDKVYILSEEYTGMSTKEKLALIRAELKKQHAHGMLITALDEVAWTLNMRGHDVHCTPVFVAYLLLEDEQTTLFIDAEKLTPQVRDYLYAQGVKIDDYENVEDALHRYSEYNILLDEESVNSQLYSRVRCAEVLYGPSVVQMLKAVKNSSEISRIRRAMVKDGIVLTRFSRWLKEEANADESELSIDAYLLNLKRQQPCFCDVSFDSIVAFGAHSAIVHYQATKQSNAVVARRGLLLVDCGSQYLDGTTDITRTYALGVISDEERRICTLVLKAHIRLACARWVAGTCGTQLDILARGILWDNGYHYGHGTGHGVGCFLSCHEGPHQIRMQHRGAPLVAGMVVSNEPGVYLEGKFGCRLENLLLVVADGKGIQGEDFYRFQTLTLCPFDRDLIDLSLLDADERKWVDAYHKEVFEMLSPHLDGADLAWLKQSCAPL